MPKKYASGPICLKVCCSTYITLLGNQSMWLWSIGSNTLIYVASIQSSIGLTEEDDDLGLFCDTGMFH
jgi:hypothetical protein